MERRRVDQLLRTAPNDQDRAERDAQRLALSDFLERPRPDVWRLR